MNETSAAHILEFLFSGIRTRGDQPLLAERLGSAFHIMTQRETAARIADFARALSAAAVGPRDRVTLHAAPGPGMLISEWGILALRGVAVIVPRSFSYDDLVETLRESNSRLAVVDRLETACRLAGASGSLPDLRHIVCLEGEAQAAIPVLSWDDFIESGRREPDRSTAQLRLITGKDTALLFYYKDGAGALQAVRYTHALLMDHARRIDAILGAASIRKQELVLTTTGWEQAVGHITSSYVPVLKETIIQISYGIPDTDLFDHQPDVIVADAAFFDALRRHVIEHVRLSGRIESAMLAKAIALGKERFELRKSFSPVPRIQQAALNATIIKKVQKLLGGKLRLFIGTDNETHYDTQLFFHAFGIELIELPQEVSK